MQFPNIINTPQTPNLEDTSKLNDGFRYQME